jgi:hydrogenase maturation factor
MTPRVIPPGKLPSALLLRLLAAEGEPPPEVRLGPAIGEDACALDVGGPSTLVVATDPITFTGAPAGRSAVAVNANDVAATGARPRWFLATLLLPPGSTEDQVAGLFGEIREALSGIGAVIVGGHTEITDAVRRPVVVGQMLGLAHRVVRSGGLRAGDVVLQIGPAPVEGAAVLAGEIERWRRTLDTDLLRAAAGAIDDPGISVVAPALLGAELGAMAMHDPTEGGLAAALWEMSSAAGLSLRVDRSAVLWFAPGVEVCRVLGADPWATLASGALLAGFAPRAVDFAIGRLREAGHLVAAIAHAEPGTGVRDEEGADIPWPERDEVARLLDV